MSKPVVNRITQPQKQSVCNFFAYFVLIRVVISQTRSNLLVKLMIKLARKSILFNNGKLTIDYFLFPPNTK